MRCMTNGGGRWRHATAALLISLAMTAGTTVAASMPAGRAALEIGQDARPKPTALSHNLQPVDQLARMQMAALDFKDIQREDALREAAGVAPRFAIPHEVLITPQTHGDWEAIGKGMHAWRLRIATENARSINLGFTKYHLPPGAQLFIYATDMSFVVRPFTNADNQPHGELWTPVVPSGDIIIELTIPQRAINQTNLTLGWINLGYRGFGVGGDDDLVLSGSCNVDVVCPEGDDWRDEISSVAVISTGGSTFCSGFMVNNVRGDQTPYFMTAAHCGVTAGNAASLVTYWNFENSYCRPPGQPGSGGTGDGSLSQFNTGSTFRASYSPSDVTLVEMNTSPDPDWFISFSGWDATGADADWAVGIHHPSTNEKRISFQWYPTTTTSYLGESVPGDGTHVRIIDWDLGTTEPGSSGSPLYNQNHQVIGQLHGGYASCTSNTSDWYGKFSVSFIGGGTPATSLKPWLDPDNTGTLVVGTLSTRGMTVSPSGDIHHLGVVGGPFTNDPVLYMLTNNTANAINYEITLTSSFGILLNGGTSPVAGTLQPGTDENLTVSLGPAINALPAGIYEEFIVFDDLTTGLTREQRHVVEVGQTGFTTTPSDGFMSSGPLGGPFTETKTYTLASTHPSPVDVTVSASAAWVSINGQSGPVTVTLNGVGDNNQIELGFSSAADNLTNGIHNAVVTFNNDDGGAGSTNRAVSLDVGRLVYHATDVPQPILDHTTTISVIDVPDDFCIGDVEVDLNITHTWIGDLTVDLTSPQGTTVRLHNRTGGSADDIVRLYTESGDGTLPDGPGTLSDFLIERAEGQWTMTVHDHASADQGTLNAWSLRLAPLGGDCPEFVVVHSFPMDVDPGWSTEGLWEFGQPQGGGGQYGNPNPTWGYSGPYVYGYNLTGDYENNLPPQHLTTTAIDCTDLELTRLRFMRYLNVERPLYDKASISISNDGTTWHQIWENPVEITDSAWNLQSYDISQYADNQPAVYIRWTMGPTDGSWQYSGWNIDDMEIIALDTADPACPEDLTGNGQVGLSDLIQLIDAWGPCAGCPEDLTGSGQVGLSDLIQLIGAWGPCN